MVHPSFSAAPWKAFRSPLFADTPPATATCVMPVCFTASRNFFIKMSTMVNSKLAARSSLWFSMKFGSSLTHFCKLYRNEVFNPQQL